MSQREQHPSDSNEGRGIRVTVEDLETGESESMVIENDYVLTCHGTCYLAHTNAFGAKGTHVLTVKGRTA